MLGVNLSGAERGGYSNSFIYGSTYSYPPISDLDYFRSKGLDLIRLPVSWEALQPSLNGNLDSAEVARLSGFIQAAADRGLQVIVDVHNFGRYYGNPIGSTTVPISAFQDFWTKLASALHQAPGIVGFDIMNEPHDLASAAIWPAAAQAAVNGIRSVDMSTPVLVEGYQYATASDWLQVNANLNVNDPANKIFYEAHIYFDRSGTGVYSSYDADGATPDIGVTRVQPFLQWLQDTGHRGFIGEFSVPGDDARWNVVLSNFLQKITSAGLSATYWGAGDSSKYLSFSVEPLNGADKPQMGVLSTFAGSNTVSFQSSGTVTDLTVVLKNTYGTAGDDWMGGDSSASALHGGPGNDSYLIDNPSDVIIEQPGEGFDTAYIAQGSFTLPDNVEAATASGSASVTFTGNALDNVLTGSSADDVLIGLGGNDTLDGRAGADRMTGGAGDDTYRVDDLRDQVIETSGGGVDTVLASVDRYVLPDEVENGVVDSNKGLTLTGNSLDNALFGGAGNDTLNGGDGNDTLDGGAGADTLVGGAGNDVYVVDNSGDRVTEAANGGVDLIVLRNTNYTLPNNVENGVISTSQGLGLYGNELDNALFGGAGNDTLVGFAGNDTLDGGAGVDVMTGGPGDDIYVVDNLLDRVIEDAGGGSDQVVVTVSGYVLAANVENGTVRSSAGLVLTGNELDNYLLGGSGADTLNGGAGNDTLDGGAGADILAGGAGNDLYVVDHLNDVIIEAPGEGTDIVLSMVSGYVLPNGVEMARLGIDSSGFLTGNGGDNTLVGGQGNDHLFGLAGNDILDGAGGADELVGGTGNDIYVVDNPSDVVRENPGEGQDQVVVLFSGYTLPDAVEGGTVGTAGGLTLYGNALNNFLTGGAGDDQLFGGAGNDILDGRGGQDTLTGGTGDDIYVIDQATDRIVENPGEGHDQVVVKVSGYVLADNLEDGTIGLGTGLTLTGNLEDNGLLGGAGNDQIFGAGGNDTLDGGFGADVLTGGSGADAFVFRPGQTNGDTITDFSGAGGENDIILFAGFGTAATGAGWAQVDATHIRVWANAAQPSEVITVTGVVTASNVFFIAGT